MTMLDTAISSKWVFRYTIEKYSEFNVAVSKMFSLIAPLFYVLIANRRSVSLHLFDYYLF